MKKELIDRTWCFIYSMEKGRPFHPEISKDKWLGNFATPLFYTYLKYCQHSGESITDDDIYLATIAMISEHYNEKQINILTNRLATLMKKFDDTISEIKKTIVAKCGANVDFESLFIIYLFMLFDANMIPEQVEKIKKILEHVCESNTFKLSSKQIACWFDQFVSDMQKIILKTGEGSFKKTDDEIENIVVGFATYLAAMFSTHRIPTELFISIDGNRSYITKESLYESLAFHCKCEELIPWCNVGLRIAYQYFETENDLTKVCIHFLLGILKDNVERNLLIKILKSMLGCVDGYSFIIEKDVSSGQYQMSTNMSFELAMLMSEVQ